MSNIVIQAENISKLYRLGKIGTGSLRQDMHWWWQRNVLKKEAPFFLIQEEKERISKNHIWALRNVSFEINAGEIWGIIGQNGAGKSTLLKILSRIIRPTEGVVRGKGKISSLLEVGTGFHAELTGRENIFIGGHMLGMTKADIRSRFDKIVEFSGVEQFLDTPVKRYSSGMYVRLAFAVAAHLEPDILIVDEVLAVGDVEFRKKCLARIKEIIEKEGKTVLMVSHDINNIELMCNKGIYLRDGSVAETGNISRVVETYLNHTQGTKSETDLSLLPGIQSIELTLGANTIRSGDDLAFRLKIQFNTTLDIKDLCLLIYDAKDIRIAILDLRPYFQDIVYCHGFFDYSGMIKKINFVEGTYSFGLFYNINEIRNQLYNLKMLTIKPQSELDIVEK
ncbi:MAG: ABC transporter ATP-binding protein, partial [Bacteroidota bacterium]|nr:ABC transporter ATP-binding protein [Bacteroidota bacterium]